MQGRPHSLSDHRAFQLALIAFVCVVMAFLGVSSPSGLAGTDWLTRQTDLRVEQVKAPNLTVASSVVQLGIRCSEGIHHEVVELEPEPTEEDETEHHLLEGLRLGVAPVGIQTGLSELSADPAVTPFLLRAFSRRGSPLA